MAQISTTIKKLTKAMIPAIVDSFYAANWPKPASIFETYLEEQNNEQRMIWVAFNDDAVAGYITLNYASLYHPFQEQNIPEIMDFNVLPAFRKQGIGTTLLKLAEQKALESHHAVGLGVGLYADYGQALKLYIKHGYQPDGRGVTYHYQPVTPGANVCLDDDLVLWFTKSRTWHPSFKAH